MQKENTQRKSTQQTSKSIKILYIFLPKNEQRVFDNLQNNIFISKTFKINFFEGHFQLLGSVIYQIILIKLLNFTYWLILWDWGHSIWTSQHHLRRIPRRKSYFLIRNGRLREHFSSSMSVQSLGVTFCNKQQTIFTHLWLCLSAGQRRPRVLFEILFDCRIRPWQGCCVFE